MIGSTIRINTRQTPLFGSLSFFESNRDVPFDIKRIYYIYQVPEGAQRGGHAHKTLSQILFCPYGQISVVLDNGISKEKVSLDDPSKGLLISKGIWHDMVWDMGSSVLCVAASEHYDEDDYIRNYDKFLKLVKEGYWK